MPRNALLFVLVALAQLAVPAWMIIGHERIRSEGEVFNFRTAPVDPRDPFRGEYVRLEFEAENGNWPAPRTGVEAYTNQRAFAVLGTDSAGHAVVQALTTERPISGAYVDIYYTSFDTSTVTRIDLPFDRYYLEEGDGKKTEDMLLPQWNDGVVSQPLPAHAVVRILNGKAVITDLVVGDKSIHEWLKETLRNTPVADPVPEPVEEPTAEPTSEPAGS